MDPLIEGIEGTKSLDMTTFGLTLPKDVFTSGQKRWINPKDLAFIKKYRARIRREMRRFGLRFGSVYIVPDEHLEESRKMLEEIETEFVSEREAFVADLDNKIRKWANAHPDYADVIQESALDANAVRRRVTFSLRDYEIELDTDEDGNITDSRLAGGLDSQMAEEIASLVKDGWRDKKEQKTTRKSLTLLEKVRAKVKALSFISPGMASDILDMADDVIGSLPKKGAIEGKDYVRLESLFHFLSDPERLLKGKTSIEDEPEPQHTDSATAAGSWIW